MWATLTSIQVREVLPAAEEKERVMATAFLHSSVTSTWAGSQRKLKEPTTQQYVETAMAIGSRAELEGPELRSVYADNKPKRERPAVLQSQEAESGKGHSPAFQSSPGAGSLQGSGGSTDLRVISLLREPQSKGVCHFMDPGSGQGGG